MANTGIEVRGLKELSAKLKSMPVKLGRRTLRKAVGEGGKVFLYTALEKVRDDSYDSGNLWRSIKMSLSSRRGRGTVLNATAKVGVVRGATAVVSRKKGTSYEYWKAVEFGLLTEFGSSKRPAESFLRSTISDQNKQAQAIKFVSRALKKGIIESAI